MSDYQVIIIGGRPAGASLAIWLGRQNINTLLIDKATFPSLPSVPSGPILYNQHMDMLEELGLTEEELFYTDARIDALVVEYVDYFSAVIPVSIADVKRSYAYGADRMKFDAALWDHATRCDSVTARSGFSVTGILKENTRVTGIKGQSERDKEETITADLVVGADGRYSFAAQHFAAAILEEYNDHITSTYFADWENVPDGLLPHTFTNYNTGKGLNILMIPIDTRKYIVAVYMRPEHHKAGGKIDDFYHEALAAIAPVADRLKGARRVTPVIGLKGIRNGYRQPAGDGWALVGDAYHYKDPVDGQGIYDALVEAKLLAEAIHQWQSGSQSWQEAGQEYAAKARDAIRPMLLQTVKNVKQTMFADPPPFIIKTVVRWLISSPEFQRDYMRLLNRASDPAKWQTPGVMPRAMLRGILNNLFPRKLNETTVEQSR
jgi:2-polyprenyl-6-methoxyphenol hydroxylase-like FAD-dependent oxidoreductase